MNSLSHPDNIFILLLSIFTGFFAVVNPIANTPIYMSLTDSLDIKGKKKVAKTAVLVAFGIVAIFTLGGSYIFKLFGLTIPAFKITGGLLIFYVGFEMIKSQRPHLKTHLEDSQGNDDSDTEVGISPLGTPLLAGPGSIITALNFTTGGHFSSVIYTLIIYAIMLFLNYICFVSGNKLVKFMGKDLIKVFGKIMGLILAVMGTGILIAGIELLVNK
ncbi:MAG: MarC family protein [Bacteroidales bacterium]